MSAGQLVSKNVRFVAPRRAADRSSKAAPPLGLARELSSGVRAEFYWGDAGAPRPDRLRVGVLALIERDGALLLERRSDCGRWGLVGGMVELGESLEGGLRREVREETGLDVVGCSLFRFFDDPTRIVRYPDGNVVRLLSFAYEVRVEDFGALRRSEESEELRYFGHEELAGLDVIETARPIIEAYVSRDAGPGGDRW